MPTPDAALPVDAPAGAVLWTGGKDSCLALLRVRERLDLRCLATFVPDPPRPFRAHPLATMRAQAAALALPHRLLPVREPFAATYEAGIDALAAEGIEVLVTGDLDRVAGHPSWIVERAAGRAAVERPLWEEDRAAVLRELVERGVRAVITLAPAGGVGAEYVGRALDAALVEELIARHGEEPAGGGPPFDACGENGEYHTCVLDAPGFARPLALVDPRAETRGEYRQLVFAAIR